MIGKKVAMRKVAVIYHQFPHYRASILRALALSEKYSYEFWASTDDFHGIKAFRGDELVKVNPLQVKMTKRGFAINGVGKILGDPTIDCYLILGNPNILATWWIAIVGRLKGRRVAFWAHGWLKREMFAKAALRLAYFNLANIVLVYSERAKRLAKLSHFPEEKVLTIFNSLDFDKSSSIFEKIEVGLISTPVNPRSFFASGDRPLLICTARLTQLCRLDLLLQAAAHMRALGLQPNILLVGEGPERSALEKQAKQLQIDVHFFGACYEEETVGQLIYHSDATVSPGKIGLTAIHSLTYGTPAFTHNDWELQMPEVEAIEPGLTGALFQPDDPLEIAQTLRSWLASNQDRPSVRRRCRAAIAEKWNAANQRRMIEIGLDRCFAGIVDGC